MVKKKIAYFKLVDLIDEPIIVNGTKKPNSMIRYFRAEMKPHEKYVISEDEKLDEEYINTLQNFTHSIEDTKENRTLLSDVNIGYTVSKGGCCGNVHSKLVFKAIEVNL